MSHHCGLVFESILQGDEGIWKCKMDLTDQYSNTHSFKKVIDLKVNKRKRRGDTQAHYSGGYANFEFGSGDGSGDDEPSYHKSNNLRNSDFTRLPQQRFSAGCHTFDILNYKRLCPCVCESVTPFCITRIKYLNTPSQCSDSDLNI